MVSSPSQGVDATARLGPHRDVTPIFIHTFRLDLDDRQAALLERRFDAARRLYNATLAESLRRAALLRQSRQWTKARRLRRESERRKALLRRARDADRFRRFDLFPFVGELCRGEMGRHLDLPPPAASRPGPSPPPATGWLGVAAGPASSRVAAGCAAWPAHSTAGSCVGGVPRVPRRTHWPGGRCAGRG